MEVENECDAYLYEVNNDDDQDDLVLEVTKANPKTVSWQERIAQLTSFKLKYGLLEIPTSRLNPDFKLGGWLAAQRSLQKRENEQRTRKSATRDGVSRFFS